MRKNWLTWGFLLTTLILGLIKPAKVLAQIAKVEAIDDSSVNEESKNSNMNYQSKLLVGVDQQGSAYNRVYSFIRFGSSLNLPPGMEISKSNLVIYLEHSTGLPVVDLRISRVTSNWYESVLTWNNQPTFADGITVSVNSTSEIKKYDITNIVKYWKNNPTKNFGVQIAGIINNQPYIRTFSDRSGRNLYLETTYYNPADHTPPVISNIKTVPSKTTARVTWSTNELLKEASVEYGLTNSLGKKAFAISTQSTAFQVNLTGLKSSTPYSYKIKSVDFAGNERTQTGGFITSGSIAQPLPDSKTASGFNSTVQNITITNLKATEVTYKSALITWDTNIPANSTVEYGKAQRTLDKQKTSSALLTRHSVRIDGLTANTRYFYLVKSGAPSTHTVSFPPGDPQIFLTKTPTAAETAADSAAAAQIGREIGKEIAEDLNNLGNSFNFGIGATQTALVISSPKVTNTTLHNAIARWVTNKPATGEVFYWQPGLFAKSIGTTAHTTNHIFTLSNLEPNSRYNYLLRSKTNSGESIVSPEAYFISGFDNSSLNTLFVEGLSITSQTHDGTVFVWTTNKPADELLVLTDLDTNTTTSKEDHTYQTQHTQTFQDTDLNPDSPYAIKLTVKTQIGETRVVTSQFRSLALLDSGTIPPVGGDPQFPDPLDEEILSEDQDWTGEFINPDQLWESSEDDLLTENEESDGNLSEPVSDSAPTSVSEVSALNGVIGNIPIIGKLLGTGSSGPKPDLTKILLILLVIILILILLFRKRADKPIPVPPAAEIAPKISAAPLKISETKTPEKVEPAPETIIPEKKPKKRKWLVFIIFLILAIVIIQNLGFLVNPAMLLAPFMSKILDKNLSAPKADVSFNYIEGTGPDLSVKKLAQDQWPEGTRGGTFEISPAGEFKNLAKLSITLDKPITGFTLGYWYPESKKWIRIPTIRRSGSTYEGYLTHASLVAGSTVRTSQSSISGSQGEGVAGSGDFKFRDPGLQKDWEQIEVYLETLRQNYDRGTGGGTTDINWNLIEGVLSKMSSVVISHCRNKPAMADRIEFLQVMSLAQLYAFNNIFQSFNAAWSSCIPLDKEVQTSAYIIKQTDKIPYSYTFTGIGKATGESTIISDGVVISKGKGFGWQGDWQVVQNTSGSSQILNQLNLGGLTSSGVNSSAKTKDLTMLLFSLEGVTVGSEFPLYIVRIGTYEEELSGPTQDVIFSLNNHVFGTGRITPDRKTISGKGGLEVRAKLIESYGKNGALISYGEGGMGSIGGQQGEAIKQIGKMAEANPALKQLYDEMMAQSPAEVKLKIIPSGI